MQILSFALGAVAAVALVHVGLEAPELLYRRPILSGVIAAVIIPLCAAIPTWFVGRLHPRLSRAYLFAYFAALLALFAVIALLNITVEL